MRCAEEEWVGWAVTVVKLVTVSVTQQSSSSSLLVLDGRTAVEVEATWEWGAEVVVWWTAVDAGYEVTVTVSQQSSSSELVLDGAGALEEVVVATGAVRVVLTAADEG